MTDKILIRDLEIFAYHGVNAEEKEEGQPFLFDVDCYVDLANACQSDCLEDTVSYAKIIKTIRRVFTAEKYDLIERAAQVAADAVLEAFPQVRQVDMTLKKPQAPVKATFDWVGVFITRSKS